MNISSFDGLAPFIPDVRDCSKKVIWSRGINGNITHAAKMSSKKDIYKDLINAKRRSDRGISL